jgi:hypothetical protein
VEFLGEERAHLARIEQSALSAHGTEAAPKESLAVTFGVLLRHLPRPKFVIGEQISLLPSGAPGHAADGKR